MSHFDFPDIREELKRLNKELLIRFTALVANMVQAPSQYERRVEEISLLVNNIHHLLNAVRPSQARSTLEHALTEQAKQKRERLDDLREWTKKASTDGTSEPSPWTHWTVKAGWRCAKPRRGGLEHDVTNLRKRARSSREKSSRTAQKSRTVGENSW